MIPDVSPDLLAMKLSGARLSLPETMLVPCNLPHAEACEDVSYTDGSARQVGYPCFTDYQFVVSGIPFNSSLKQKSAAVSLPGAPLLCFLLGSRHCFRDSNGKLLISCSTRSKNVSNGHAKDLVRKKSARVYLFSALPW
jgi:hypothetical protein